MVGVFKLNHRDVYGVDDATGLICVVEVFIVYQYCLFDLFVHGGLGSFLVVGVDENIYFQAFRPDPPQKNK